MTEESGPQGPPAGDAGEDGALRRARAEAQRRFQLYLSQVQAGSPIEAEPDGAGLDPATAEELRRIVADYRSLRRDYREAAGCLAAGCRLGPFRLLREIGRGGMGVVWEAERIPSGLRLALKILQPQLAPDEAWLERFRRESMAASSVEHEHIVKVHEMGEHDGLHWIAMELVPGGLTLADHVADLRRRGAAPPDHARRMARMFRDLALALHATHQAGVVHRDIKPGNILLHPDGSPKLADFGLASLEGLLSGTRSGERVGSPYYMSPEQAGGGSRSDARSDIYSLGVSLYECLTFERPHAGRDEHELLRRIVQEDVPDPRLVRPGLPRDLARIVQRMAANRRAGRYASAAAAADDLERFLAGRRVQAGAPWRLRRACKLARRHPAWSSAIAGALGASLLLLSLSVRASSEELRAGSAAELVQAVIRLDDPASSFDGPDAPLELARLLHEAATSAAASDGPRAARLHLAAARCERLAGRLRQASASLKAALERLDAGAEEELRLQMLDTLSGVLGELDDFAGLQEILPQALELSKRLDKPEAGELQPPRRTWRLLCGLWNGHLRREDGAAAVALEAAHPELSRGDMLGTLRARCAALAAAHGPQDERVVESRLQLLRALCSLERHAEASELAASLESAESAAGASERESCEIALLASFCDSRLRRLPAGVHRRQAQALAMRLAELHGPSDPLSLAARLRWCVASMDDPASAQEPGGWPAVRDRYRALVEDMLGVLGPLHLDTLKARTGLLLAEMRTGDDEPRLRGLLAAAEELVASMRQVYGEFHSRTVIAERVRLALHDLLGGETPAIDPRRRFVDHFLAGNRALAADVFDLQNELVELLLRAGEPAEALRRVHDLRQTLERLDAGEVPRAQIRLRAILLLSATSWLGGDPSAAQDALGEWELLAPAAALRMAEQGISDRVYQLLRRTLDACIAEDAVGAAALAEQWSLCWIREGHGDPLALLLLSRCGWRLRDARLGAALERLRAVSLAAQPRLRSEWAQIDFLAAREQGLRPR